jgi:uncharacterized protein YkwD
MWMNSAGHRANILNGRALQYGLAVTGPASSPNWVMVVGRDC